jgi:hypothetical protein
MVHITSVLAMRLDLSFLIWPLRITQDFLKDLR